MPNLVYLMRNIVCSNNGKIPETIFIAFGCGKLKIEKNYYSFSKITDTLKMLPSYTTTSKYDG